MSGFERGAYGQLSDLHRELREKFTYITDQEKWKVVERWEDNSTLRSNINRVGIQKFTGDCEEFSLVSLEKAHERGFNVRMVLCLVETGEGHAICEVASPDFAEAYYFDNRQIKVATAGDLKNYRFLAVGPWNPEKGEQRPWLKVKQ